MGLVSPRQQQRPGSGPSRSPCADTTLRQVLPGTAGRPCANARHLAARWLLSAGQASEDPRTADLGISLGRLRRPSRERERQAPADCLSARAARSASTGRPPGANGHQVPACGCHLDARDVGGPPGRACGNADRSGAPGIPGARDLGGAGARADDQPTRLVERQAPGYQPDPGAPGCSGQRDGDAHVRRGVRAGQGDRRWRLGGGRLGEPEAPPTAAAEAAAAPRRTRQRLAAARGIQPGPAGPRAGSDGLAGADSPAAAACPGCLAGVRLPASRLTGTRASSPGSGSSRASSARHAGQAVRCDSTSMCSPAVCRAERVDAEVDTHRAGHVPVIP